MRAAEIPSANCHASARAMAKLGALMAGNGTLNNLTIMSNKTVHLAQGNPNEKYDKVVKATTKFTTGGWAVFDSDFGCNRQGSIGWFGIGGSVLQWHRELNVILTYYVYFCCLSVLCFVLFCFFRLVLGMPTTCLEHP